MESAGSLGSVVVVGNHTRFVGGCAGIGLGGGRTGGGIGGGAIGGRRRFSAIELLLAVDTRYTTIGGSRPGLRACRCGHHGDTCKLLCDCSNGSEDSCCPAVTFWRICVLEPASDVLVGEPLRWSTMMFDGGRFVGE